MKTNMSDKYVIFRNTNTNKVYALTGINYYTEIGEFFSGSAKKEYFPSYYMKRVGSYDYEQAQKEFGSGIVVEDPFDQTIKSIEDDILNNINEIQRLERENENSRAAVNVLRKMKEKK